MRKIFTTIVCLLLAGGLFVSCEDDVKEEKDLLEVDYQTMTFTAQDASVKTATVKAGNVKWRAESEQEWIIINENQGTFDVTVEPYLELSKRSGKITVTSGDNSFDLKVWQEGMVYRVSTDPKTLDFSPLGEPQLVAITTNGGEWSAASESGWIHLTKNSEADQLTVTLDPNPTDKEKTGTITVTLVNRESEIAVTQAGVTLGVDKLELDIKKEGNDPQKVTVTTNTVWDATTSDGWINISKSGNVLTVDAEPNATTDGKVGKVTVTAGDLFEDITVRQVGIVYELSVNPSSLEFIGNAAPSQDVTVTTDAPSWSVSTDDEWITVTEGDGKFTVEVKNYFSTSSSERPGTITVTVAGGVTKNVAVKQTSASMDEFFQGTWTVTANDYQATPSGSQVTWTSVATKDDDGKYIFSNWGNRSNYFLPITYENDEFYCADTKHFIFQGKEASPGTRDIYYFLRWRYSYVKADQSIGWIWWGSGGNNNFHAPTIDVDNLTITFPSTYNDATNGVCTLYLYLAGYWSKDEPTSTNSANYRAGSYYNAVKMTKVTSQPSPAIMKETGSLNPQYSGVPVEESTINIK